MKEQQSGNGEKLYESLNALDEKMLSDALEYRPAASRTFAVRKVVLLVALAAVLLALTLSLVFAFAFRASSPMKEDAYDRYGQKEPTYSSDREAENIDADASVRNLVLKLTGTEEDGQQTASNQPGKTGYSQSAGRPSWEAVQVYHYESAQQIPDGRAALVWMFREEGVYHVFFLTEDEFAQLQSVLHEDAVSSSGVLPEETDFCLWLLDADGQTDSPFWAADSAQGSSAALEPYTAAVWPGEAFVRQILSLFDHAS